MIGLVVLGMMIPRTVDRFRSFDRTVNVKGLCEKFAKDSDSRLDKIKTANQGTFTIENRDNCDLLS